MRIVVYGVGAIGGTIAASLALAGHDVAGIARGKMLDAIREDGLRLRTPLIDERVRFACFGSPDGIDFRDDDAIILTMKSQDTLGALDALRAAGVTRQPIVCGQNGVDNERMALRRFENVYGMTVMCPATYVRPGEVVCHGYPRRAIFDLGRYPHGSDGTAEAIAAALDAAQFRVDVQERVMASKYGKLLQNQANAAQAALGANVDMSLLRERLQAEGEAVYRAAGVEWTDIRLDGRRAGIMELGDVPGVPRAGDSSTQSLTRGTGSIESDYLNGEIVLLGRLHGVPTPINAWLSRVAERMARTGMKPGTLPKSEIDEGLRLAGLSP